MPIDRTSHLTVQKHDPNRRQRSFCHSFAHFLCSNVGLILIIVAYSIGGAYLFILLEQYVELQKCQQANLQENVSISNISETLFNSITIAGRETNALDTEVIDTLDNFINDVFTRKSTYRYSGQDCPTTSGWSFPSALLFTISIVTSIGYGHITPVSWEGQITCICYALIGIPIFLLCLANISSILGDIFRFLYSTFLHCICCACRIYARSHRPKRTARSRNFPAFEYVGTTTVDPSWPEEHQSTTEEHFRDGSYQESGESVGDYVDEEMNDVYDRMESRVPVIVVISIIIGYICLGAIMFNYFEGWTMTIAVYFCYITLSTVGFGDYVPGITAGSTNGLRFLAASFYIVIGLAILAMCFDLIKESIVDKLAWIAFKFGFLSDDDYQFDRSPEQYANFQYTQPHGVQMNKAFESPPAYDSVDARGH